MDDGRWTVEGGRPKTSVDVNIALEHVAELAAIVEELAGDSPFARTAALP
ncbi:MAG: hypothetical protein HYX50_03695 [Chloroflexi bacterium]|nr:hypothetical protein [Chloroflexota bacterium]